MSDLEILEERVLVSVPRGDDELRVSHVRAQNADGREFSWTSLRVFWRDDAGTWKPGKAGLTVRNRELEAVAKALATAARNAPDQPATTQSRRPPTHRRGPQRELPVAAPLPPIPGVNDDEIF